MADKGGCQWWMPQLDDVSGAEEGVKGLGECVREMVSDDVLRIEECRVDDTKLGYKGRVPEVGGSGMGARNGYHG